MAATSTDEILSEPLGLIRIYKDGRYQRLTVPDILPAGVDPSTGVNSKDVVFSPETNNFARLYIPNTTIPHHKLPLLIFYHGGGFFYESADSSAYHNFLNLVVSESNVVAISVDYRLAPEFPLPIGYEDSWDAIKWVSEHVEEKGPEPWLNEYADLEKIFLAGGNIAHHMAIRVGSEAPTGLRVLGAILLHPFFWGSQRVGSEPEWMTAKLIGEFDDLWALVSPGSDGPDDPFINPDMDPRLSGMGCSKILLCVSGNDFMRERGRNYKKLIEKIGWKGYVEVVEDKEETHLFFLKKPFSENACILRSRICTFINGALSKCMEGGK